MKQKLIILICALFLTCMKTFAYDFRVNGICYNITSSTDNTVAVTYYSYTQTPYYVKGYTFYYNIYVSGYSGDVTIPSTVTYNGTTYTVTSIGNYAFSDSNSKTGIYGSSVTSVTIPSTIKSIDYNAFYTCSKLKTANVNCAYIPAFNYCKGLETINLGANVTSSDIYLSSDLTSLTTINVDASNSTYSSVDGVLYNKAKTTLVRCPYAKSTISIPSTVTEIGSKAFGSCTAFSSITLPSNIKTIGENAFGNCTKLQSINIPYYVTSIPASCFSDCTSLKTITFDGAYYLTSIGDYAFSSCRSLESITLPSSVKTIGYRSFLSCSSLTELNLNSSLTTIGEYAFSYCSKLPILNIPSSVTTINSYAFSGCTGLKHVVVNWSSSSAIPTITSDVFSTSTYSDAKLHSNYLSMVSYLQSKSYWKNFKTIDKYYEGTSSAYMDMSSTNETLIIGNTIQLTATPMFSKLYAESFNEVEWSSNNERVATVDANGNVTALAQGQAVITASKVYGKALTGTCTVNVKYENSLYMNDLTSLAGSKPEFPVYMDNSKEICNLQFDVVMPEGVDIYYGENDDEEEVYWVTKGDRAKTSHTVSVKKQSSDTYRVLISSTSNVNFKDTDKSLPIANIKLDINKDQEVGSYDIKLKNIMLTNYSDGVTTPISVVDTVAKIIVPPSYTIAVTPSTGGTVKVTGDSYDESVQQTTYGSSVTMTATPATGYHFINWTENNTALSTNNPYTLSNVSADHTIKANFAANTYKVTFVVDGNTYSEGQQTYGQKLTLPTAPTKTGYTFTGWEGVTSSTIVPANDVTCNAVFTINQYTVKFIADGNVVYEEKQDYQSTITAPDAPVKDSYAFVTWGNVLDVVPANDVTYTAEYVLIGDVYEDSEINVADLTSLVGIILSGSENLTKHVMKEADVYSDDKVNVADYTNLVALILGSGSNAKAMSMINTDYNETTLNGTFVENNDGNTSSIILNLVNAKDVTAYQFDIDIPNGYQFVDKDMIMKKNLNNHTVMTKLQEDGSLRVVVCSNTNAAISTDNQLVLNLVSKDNGSFGEIATIKNVVCATSNHGFDLEDSYIIMNATAVTSINNAEAGGTLNIKVVNHNVYLTSNVDKDVCIYSTDGTIINSIQMIAGKEEVVTLPSGVYVVNSKKIIIK